MNIATCAESIADGLQLLPETSLEELQSNAALLTRRDRKYLVPNEMADCLLNGIDPASRMLQIGQKREFAYTTRYFDAEHTAYFRSLRRRPNRFKVRTRLYNDTGICQLEVKVRDGRGLTVKERRCRDQCDFADLHEADRQWLRGVPQIGLLAGRLSPCMSTFYWRSTVVFPDSAGRMTIDRDLQFVGLDGNQLALPGWLTIETKSPGPPTLFDRYLWANGFRPLQASKFALGICLLNPALPANRWRRLLNRLEDHIIELT